MAEIDAEELERALRTVNMGPSGDPPGSDHFAQLARAHRIIESAAEAHLEHLRAPKGELEEARAELGAFLVEMRGAYTFDTGRVGMVAGRPRPDQPWFCTLYLPGFKPEGWRGEGPTEAAAIRAALSRARGEGT